MNLLFLNDLLVLLGVRAAFPDVLGLGSLFSFILVFSIICVGFYYVGFKLHELMFYKEEKTKLEEVVGMVKAKKTENRKSLFSRGKVKEVKILVIATRKMGEIFVENDILFNKFNKKDPVVVLFQKRYLVRRFKKDAKFLGVHVVDVLKKI